MLIGLMSFTLETVDIPFRNDFYWLLFFCLDLDRIEGIWGYSELNSFNVE